MSSEDDNVRTDEYWMGVRDALRMVDSFNKWSKRNPGRAKSLDDFIHDGLIAAAKRCESCLRDKLGLSFIEGEEDEDEIGLEDSSELDTKPDIDEEEDDDDDHDDADDIILEESVESEDEPEEEPEESESSIESSDSYDEPEPTLPPEDTDESSITLDNVERREYEEMEDLSIAGPPREFSTDFDLVEPTPLVVDEDSSTEYVTTEEESTEEPSEPALDVEPETSSEPEELPEKPSFTWAEYEDAVTPSSEPEPLDPDVDIIPSEEEETSTYGDDDDDDDDEEEEEEEEALPLEPPEPPKEWSPYDEPSIQEEDAEIYESDSIEEGEGEPVITEPPPPPPPPESEEDEEERKRRARRLFFGA